MVCMPAEHVSQVLTGVLDPARTVVGVRAGLQLDGGGGDRSLVVLLLTGFVAIVLAIVGLALAAAARTRRTERREAARRSDALREWARVHGWQFHDGEVRAGWRDRLAAGNRDFTVHRLVHRDLPGGPVTVAACSYRVDFSPALHEPGQRRRPDRVRAQLTVTLLRLPGHRPDVYVRRFEPLLRSQGWLPERYGEIAAAHLVRPVPSGHPEFDGRVRVGSPDPASARALLTPAVIDAHLRRELDTWALCAGELTLVQETELRPDTVEPAVQRIHRLASLVTRSD